MFTLLAKVSHRGRWLILALSLALTIAASVWGPGIFKDVTTAGSFVVSGSESDRTSETLSQRFPDTDYDVIAVVRPAGDGVDAAELRGAVDTFIGDLDRDKVAAVATPWTPPANAPPTASPPASADNPLLGADGTEAVVLLTLAGEDAQTRNNDFVELRDETSTPDGFDIGYAGQVPTEEAIGTQTKADVTTAEMISLPLLAILLLIVFGTLTSSLLPVLIGGAAMVGSFAALRVIAGTTEVSIFAVTISSILSLVLAVDYGLIIVSRYRDELARGRQGLPALTNTLRSAGETVSISGLLVLVSLSVLLLFPQTFLKSMAYGGISTVAVALVFALLVLPACLAILGPRINSLKVPGRLRERRTSGNGGFLHRLSHTVMRRPVTFVMLTLVVLAPLVIPAFGLKLGSVDHRVLPPDHVVAQTTGDLDRNFPEVDLQPVKVLVEGGGQPDQAQLADIAAVPGIAEVAVRGVESNAVHLQATLEDDWQSDAAVDAVERVRELRAPEGSTVSVGGLTAEMVDQSTAIRDTAPLALGILLLAILVLLTVAFRSVILPLKAVLMNLLSVSAAFGVMVWIFQDGHLQDVLGFTATGTLDPSNLILIFALIFGLSMDYEVFMLSRVKEEYDRTGNNQESVAKGLQETGGIITAAAGLLLVVVGAFSFSGISFIKMIGIGMLTAIIVDVVIIRALLVPATMRLLGDLNWWPGHRRGTGGGRHVPAGTRDVTEPERELADTHS